MKSRRQDSWSRLDNAAKIFPPTSSKVDPKVFRFACELYEPVDPDLLQQALDKTVDAFPLFRSVLRKGLFWYYLESSPIRALVQEESQRPCLPLYDQVSKDLLFRVIYYRSRISLEIYHALTDGTGALQFLRVLVTNYLGIRHADVFGGNPPCIDYDASQSEKRADSFQKYYSRAGEKKAKIKQPPAYQVRGARLTEHHIQVIEGLLSVKQALAKAHEYHASLTAFLSAVFLCAIYEEIPVRDRKKPVVLAVPVNLRNYFSSETARNFFGLFTVGYDFQKQSPALEDVIQYVSGCFERELTAERLSERMNGLAALEHNAFVKIVPLAVKDMSMRMAANLSARGETASLSNIGPVGMPEELKSYIRLFDVFISGNRPQICMCSFGDNLMLSMTSPFLSCDIQKNFFRTLSSMGLSVIIRANRVDEE